MRADYRELTQNIKNRNNPDHISVRKSFTEELSTVRYSDVLVYVRYAMKGVEEEYTQKSKLAGERVKAHLEKEITDISFRYQGSVMTNTHIKGHSDIDLLTITEKFYSLDRKNISDSANSSDAQTRFFSHQIEKLRRESQVSIYQGDSLVDLRQLRNDCELTLRNKYSICDTTKPKSIKIKNQDLNREVDIVVANWYDDVTSVVNDKGLFRGIQVYNKDEHLKGEADYPFLSIDRINQRSASTYGRLKKMIRFLKNVKADSDLDIALSSFDFNAICYDISTDKYSSATFIELLPVIYNQLRSIVADTNHANRLISVDGREYIFRNNPSKLENVRKILREVDSIYADSRKSLINS